MLTTKSAYISYMYKAIGFDLGGVIIDYSPKTQQEYLARVLEVAPTVLSQAYRMYRPQVDAGMISNSEFWDYLITATASRFDPIATGHLWNEGYEQLSLVDGMLELVDRLRGNGYKTAMFSNLDPDHTAIDRRRGLFDHFDVAVVSNEIREIKPHPKAYQILAAKLDILTSELIFIDDTSDNVTGAEEAGCLGLLFANTQDLIMQLRQLKINCD